MRKDITIIISPISIESEKDKEIECKGIVFRFIFEYEYQPKESETILSHIRKKLFDIWIK